MAALAAAASILPPGVRRALAQEMPGKSSLRDIKHVVLLMQENRSFDHYFGTMAGVRGFDDPNAIILPNGKSVFHQPDAVNPNGYLLPFHLDTKKTNAQKHPSTNHGWECQHESWNGGRMDNWLPAHRKADKAKAPYVMGYHTRADMTAAFRFDDKKSAPPKLPATAAARELARSEAAVLPPPAFPGADQNIPTQEKGRRKRVPEV